MTAPAGAPPRAVTFDYWNTLCYEPDIDRRRALVAESWSAVFSESGITVDQAAVFSGYDAARREYWSAWHANRQYTGTDAAHTLLAHLGSEGRPAALTEALVDAFHACSESTEVVAIDGVDAVLDALNSAGVKVGIVCDVGLMPSSYLRRHLDRHGLLGSFDHWSFSDEVGVYKPDRRIFEHALAGLGGVDPADAVHVGDRRRTDVAGAQAMGMRSLRFTGVYDDDDVEQGPSGDGVLAHYGEFLAAVGLG